MNALMLLAALFVLFYLQAFVIRHFALKRLTYERRFSKQNAFEGETVQMIEVIQNKKLLPVPLLKAESRISPNLSFIKAVDTQISGEQYHKSVFYLKPYTRLIRSHTVRLKKRGCYQAGMVGLTATDLLGVDSMARKVETAAAIEVYPRVMPLSDMPLPASRWQGDLIVKRWIMPDPLWVSGIRAYTPGDALSSIHWRATARAGELQVKVHEPTADIKMLVVINAQMTELQWADLMPYEQQTVEDMISLAAGLSVEALKNGMEAGFAVNLPMDSEDCPTILPPARHADREGELLSAMAHLTIARTRTFPMLLDMLSAFTGMDMLLLSVYDSEMIQEKIEMLRLRGNTVQLHVMSKEKGGEAVGA